MALISTTETSATGVPTWEDGPTVISEESAFKRPVQVASTGNVNLGAVPTSIDGIALANGDRILLKNQGFPFGAENGIYERLSASSWQRATDFEVGAFVEAGTKVYVQKGTENEKRTFRLYAPTTTILVGTIATSWEDDGATLQNAYDNGNTITTSNAEGGAIAITTTADETDGAITLTSGNHTAQTAESLLVLTGDNFSNAPLLKITTPSEQNDGKAILVDVTGDPPSGFLAEPYQIKVDFTNTGTPTGNVYGISVDYGTASLTDSGAFTVGLNVDYASTTMNSATEYYGLWLQGKPNAGSGTSFGIVTGGAGSEFDVGYADFGGGGAIGATFRGFYLTDGVMIGLGSGNTSTYTSDFRLYYAGAGGKGKGVNLTPELAIAAGAGQGSGIFLESTAGGAASGAQAGAGGRVSIESGDGGAADATASGVANDGGEIDITAGTGGAGHDTQPHDANAGGLIDINGGTGGASAGGASAGGLGGNIELNAGTGGVGGTAGSGGAGGNIVIDAGAGGADGGGGGAGAAGTITIGGSNETAIDLATGTTEASAVIDLINTTHNVSVFAGITVPTTGFAANEGSLFLRDNAGTGEIWLKTGAASTAWTQLALAGASVSLQNAYDGGATITTSGSTDIAFTLSSGGFTTAGTGLIEVGNTGSSPAPTSGKTGLYASSHRSASRTEPVISKNGTSDTNFLQRNLWGVVGNAILHSRQLRPAGATQRVGQANFFFLTTNAAVGDTFTISDGTTTETWTAVGGPPAANQFNQSGTLAQTLESLATQISANSARWDAEWYGQSLNNVFLGATGGGVVIYQTSPQLAGPARLYGTFASASSARTFDFSGDPDYRRVGEPTADVQLPSVDPGVKTFGFNTFSQDAVDQGDTYISILDQVAFQSNRFLSNYNQLGGAPFLARVPGWLGDQMTGGIEATAAPWQALSPIVARNEGTATGITAMSAIFSSKVTIATTDYFLACYRGATRIGGVRGNGDSTTIVYEAFSGGHVGQCMGSSIDPTTGEIDDGTRVWEPGMIVVGTGMMCSNPDDGVINYQPQIALATAEKDTAVVGVYAGASMEEWGGCDPSLPLINYGALGRTRVLVTDESGNVNNGDLITTSTTPGYGMLQTVAKNNGGARNDDLVRSITVAKCMQQVDWASITDTINGYKYALVACFVYSG